MSAVAKPETEVVQNQQFITTATSVVFLRHSVDAWQSLCRGYITLSASTLLGNSVRL